MQAPDLPIFEALFSVPHPDAFTAPGDDQRWPEYLHANQTRFLSHLREMSPGQRAFMWAFLRASIANRMSIYYTNTHGDCGLRIGFKDQADSTADAVWFMPEFPHNRPVCLRICKSHPGWAEGGLNSPALFDADGPTDAVRLRVDDLERRAGNGPAVVNLLDDTPFDLARFPSALVARYLPIAHPVNGFGTNQEANAYRTAWLFGLTSSSPSALF